MFDRKLMGWWSNTILNLCLNSPINYTNDFLRPFHANFGKPITHSFSLSMLKSVGKIFFFWSCDNGEDQRLILYM